MARLLRWVAWGLAGITAVAVLAAIGGYFWLRTSLPKQDEKVAVAGLSASVEVLRDEHGVPHIFARTQEDATFALGFVHAQDRLWQMEAMRRLGRGRLAEVVGSRAVGTDRYMRTLGLYRLAQAQFARAPEKVQRLLQAYADGVNALLAHRDGAALAPEFVALSLTPEPWQPADSVLWGPLMAWRLGTNRHQELLRARLGRALGAERMAELWPPYPAGAPVTMAALDRLSREVDLEAILAADPAWLGTPVGASNIWAVTGAKTASGKPLLANDPHLPFSIPGTWYLARIVTPGLSLTGATAPGVPFVVLGHNDRIAWGMTTANADIEDLYVELVDPNNPQRYLVPGGGSQPFTTRDEVIAVRGGEDVHVTVRSTRHGPVISDVMNRDVDLPIQAAATRSVDHSEDHTVAPAGPRQPASAPILALAASYLREDDQAVSAIFALNRAQDWPTFNEALAGFHVTPQNVFYADVDGNIGFVTPGRIPIRRNGHGFVPSAGWTGETDWTGFIPYDRMPRALNPPSGRLINANNKLVPDDYTWFISNDWEDPYRAERIARQLDGMKTHSLAAMTELQMDSVSLMARHLLPKMLRGLPTELPQAASGLRSWHGEMERSRKEPLIFEAWLRALGRAVYGDELGADLARYWGHRPGFLDKVLKTDSVWCDDVTTPARETCADCLRASLERALADLETELGAPDEWSWGKVHRARFDHRLFGAIPILRTLADRKIPQDGGYYTINRGANYLGSSDDPFASIHGAGYRAVYDLSDLAHSRFMVVPGQSGNPLSTHYDDLIEDWRDGQSFELGNDPEDLRQNASARLLLDPQDTIP